MYSYINKQKKNKDNIRSLRREPGELTFDLAEIANLLNDQFYSLFSRPSSDCLTPTLETVTSTTFSGISNQTFKVDKIKIKLQNLNKFKPAGIDGVHPHVLAECFEELALPLSIIFNNSYETAILPSLWSQANITPIFKKGDKNIAENYRPISLTSVPCKIMERIVRDELLNYLFLNNLINPSQHGFVYAKSCATNLLEALDIICHCRPFRCDYCFT